jgi:hypothetical protein
MKQPSLYCGKPGNQIQIIDVGPAYQKLINYSDGPMIDCRQKRKKDEDIELREERKGSHV